MRIMVLGGAGDMGSAIVRDLVDSDVSEVIIADFNQEKANSICSELKGKKSKLWAQSVDANDHASLVQAIKGADAVASAIGPFYKYGPKTVKAAIEAGVPYVDIDDDHDATTAALELDGEAKKAGIAVIVGLGWTPGITNVCARHGTSKLDRVDEIDIAWAGTAADSAGYSVIYHVWHALSGMVPMYLDGEWRDVPAGSEGRMIDFPQPVGEVECFYCGHPEPVTIPRFIKGVKAVTLRGAFYPELLAQAVAAITQLGLASTEPVKVGEASISPRDFITAFTHSVEDIFRMGVEPCSGTWVEVRGEKGGNPTRYTYRAADRMYRQTGGPASIGAQMLARGEIKAKGVLAPEACIDPAPFFAQLAKRNIAIYETEEKTVKL